MVAQGTRYPGEKGKRTMEEFSKYRSKLRHLLAIDSAIKAGGYPNCEQLARELEMSGRTVRRNIEFLRDELGAPIEYDARHRGWTYTQRDWSLPGLRLTEGELLGLALAQMALQCYRGTPLQRHVEKLTRKIQAALPEEVNVDAAGLASLFEFSLGPTAPFKPEHWETLAQAASKRHTVWMRYHTLWKHEETTRKVDPYLLRCYRGDWYLIGFDHLRSALRIFNIARIIELRDTGCDFDFNPAFDAASFFKGTFKVSRRLERHKVKIRFSGVAARLVAEKQWHASQKLTPKKDGSILFEMTVADLDEVLSWVLSFGAMAEVIGPQELRKGVVNNIRRMKDFY